MFKQLFDWLKSLFRDDNRNDNFDDQNKVLQFKKHLVSIVVTKSDSELIEKSLDTLPVMIFDQGFAIGVPDSMVRVEQRIDGKDEIPYRLYFIVIDRAEKDPSKVKKSIVKKLSEALNCRWCHGDEMKFD